MTIAQRAANVATILDISEKTREFTSIAKVLCAAGGWAAARDLADHHQLTARARDVLHKSAILPGTTTGNMSALAQAGLATAFADSLRHLGAFDGMLPSMIRVPMRTKVAVITAGANGSTPQEAQVKQISSLALAGSELDVLKAVAIIVVAEELIRSTSPAANTLFANELRKAVAVATDLQFLAIAKTGITPTPSAGATTAGARTDINVLLQAVVTGQGSALFFLTTSKLAKSLSQMSAGNDGAFPGAVWNGGTIAGAPLLVSDALATGEIVLIDASGFAGASEDFELSDSRHATLQFDTSPDSPPSAPTVVESLWQKNMTALKCERFFAAERLRANAVAAISGAAYVP